MKDSKFYFILLSLFYFILILRLESRVLWILCSSSLPLNYISASSTFYLQSLSILFIWPWVHSWPRLVLNRFSKSARPWIWDLMASTSQVAETTNLCHCARLENITYVVTLSPNRIFKIMMPPPKKMLYCLTNNRRIQDKHFHRFSDFLQTQFILDLYFGS